MLTVANRFLCTFARKKNSDGGDGRMYPYVGKRGNKQG
ncbi:hypothetical protein Barb7_01917 [Bacteroidales bacterium Barb7]|nr:hypothetical protein Barb7_01917 [Bacteroidales bacterium Barb7]